METATFGGGCFWCVEAVFQEVDGVEEVVSGYAGGDVETPSYEEVCSGSTGHAEVVQLEYDPEEVGYRELLDVFFDVHDPTTRNREGPDVGSQYRSCVFYHDERQRDAVEEKVAELEGDGLDVVTEVASLDEFYRAEDYHQDYFRKNPSDGYCRVNVGPKLEKVRERYPGLVGQGEGRA